MKSIGKIFLILFGLTISVCTVGCGGGGGGGVSSGATVSDLSGTDSSGQAALLQMLKWPR